MYSYYTAHYDHTYVTYEAFKTFDEVCDAIDTHLNTKFDVDRVALQKELEDDDPEVTYCTVNEHGETHYVIYYLKIRDE